MRGSLQRCELSSWTTAWQYHLGERRQQVKCQEREIGSTAGGVRIGWLCCTYYQSWAQQNFLVCHMIADSTSKLH